MGVELELELSVVKVVFEQKYISWLSSYAKCYDQYITLQFLACVSESSVLELLGGNL